MRFLLCALTLVATWLASLAGVAEGYGAMWQSASSDPSVPAEVCIAVDGLDGGRNDGHRAFAAPSVPPDAIADLAETAEDSTDSLVLRFAILATILSLDTVEPLDPAALDRLLPDLTDVAPRVGTIRGPPSA